MKASLFALALAAICIMPSCGNSPKNNDGNANVTTGTLNGHEWVDLGLPSGTLWATCNVGANAPEEYGDYFAWGETNTKTNYNWDTYKYGNGFHLTKYCDNSNFGNNGFTDYQTDLQPSDDAASVNWGNGWCMPTLEQWKELLRNTTNNWVTQNGVKGCLFTAKNGQTIFFPATGGRWRVELNYVNSNGYYWTNSLKAGPVTATNVRIDSDYCGINQIDRYVGLSVRPVTSSH